MGVDLFFVLSGFLITTILLEDRKSRSYYQDFYWKRVLRILPLYVICLAGVLLFTKETRYVVVSALFVANFASLFHADSAGPFWTLAIEEQFYLLWPTLVRRCDGRKLMRWALAIGLGSCLLRVVAAAFGKHNYHLTFLRCDGLAFGAVLGCQYRERMRQRRGTTRREDVVLAACGLLGAAMFAGSRSMGGAYLIQSYGVLSTGVTLLAVAAIGLVVNHSGAPMLAPVRSLPLRFFGLISYAFYMVHIYVMEAYDHFAKALTVGDEKGYWIRLTATFAIAIGVSLLSRNLIELPAMRLRRFVLKHPAPPTEDHALTPIPLARLN